MKTKDELRELHTRLVRVLTYAKSTGIPIRALRDLIQIKVSLEYILGMNTASADAWQAATFRAISNLEQLEQAAQQSRMAANN